MQNPNTLINSTTRPFVFNYYDDKIMYLIIFYKNVSLKETKPESTFSDWQVKCLGVKKAYKPWGTQGTHNWVRIMKSITEFLDHSHLDSNKNLNLQSFRILTTCGTVLSVQLHSTNFQAVSLARSTVLKRCFTWKKTPFFLPSLLMYLKS